MVGVTSAAQIHEMELEIGKEEGAPSGRARFSTFSENGILGDKGSVRLEVSGLDVVSVTVHLSIAENPAEMPMWDGQNCGSLLPVQDVSCFPMSRCPLSQIRVLLSSLPSRLILPGVRCLTVVHARDLLDGCWVWRGYPNHLP